MTIDRRNFGDVLFLIMYKIQIPYSYLSAGLSETDSYFQEDSIHQQVWVFIILAMNLSTASRMDLNLPCCGTVLRLLGAHAREPTPTLIDVSFHLFSVAFHGEYEWQDPKSEDEV